MKMKISREILARIVCHKLKRCCRFQSGIIPRWDFTVFGSELFVINSRNEAHRFPITHRKIPLRGIHARAHTHTHALPSCLLLASFCVFIGTVIFLHANAVATKIRTRNPDSRAAAAAASRWYPGVNFLQDPRKPVRRVTGQ